MMSNEREHDLSGDAMLKICIALFGEPTMVTGDEYRWGTHGSKRLTVDNGQFYDYELEKGGNAISLLQLHGNGRPIHEQLDEFGCRLTPVPERPEAFKETARYYYTDEDGVIRYQVAREESARGNKRFKQFDAAGVPGIKGKGIDPLPYRLHEIAARPDEPVHILEGEKCCEALIAEAGVLATTNSGGGGQWSEIHSMRLSGRTCYVYEDNDAKGRAHARKVIDSLRQFNCTVYLIHFREFGEKFDVADYLKTHVKEELGERAEYVEEAAFGTEYDAVFDDDDGIPLSYELLSISDLYAMPPAKWLIDGVIAERELTVLYAPPGEGKTFLALDFALHVAAGRDWNEHTVNPGRVLYIAGEGVSGLPARVKAWHAHNEYEPVDNFWILPQTVEMVDPASMFRLSNTIREMGEFDLIVIDTVARALAGAEENSATEMGKFIGACGKLQSEHNASVLGIHHSGKDVSRGMRGSSSLLGAVNTSMSCKRVDDNQIKLTFEKQKDIELAEPISLDMVQVQVGDGVIGQSSIALELASVIAEEKHKYQLTTNERLTLKALRNAVYLVGKSPKSDRVEGMAMVVGLKDWREEAKNLMDTGKRSWLTSFSRSVSRLVEREVVGKHNDEHWVRE
jgi:hypothetical protein